MWPSMSHSESNNFFQFADNMYAKAVLYGAALTKVSALIKAVAEQVTIVIEALKPGVVSLIRDLNGNHVIQRCLQVPHGLGSSVLYWQCACGACTPLLLA